MYKYTFLFHVYVHGTLFNSKVIYLSLPVFNSATTFRLSLLKESPDILYMYIHSTCILLPDIRLAFLIFNQESCSKALFTSRYDSTDWKSQCLTIGKFLPVLIVNKTRGSWATSLTWEKEFKSINTCGYIITLMKRRKTYYYLYEN